MTREVGRLGLMLALLTSAGACGDAESDVGAQVGMLAEQDCLVILLDALHAEHLGAYGGPADVSPTIDALAAGGLRFGRAWSQTSWTLPSTVSLFTGLYQETHGVSPRAGETDARLVDAADTLAELFAQAGYDTRCYTQNPWTGKRHGLDQGFERFHEVRGDGGSLAERVLEDLTERDDRPLFAYVHFRRPHTPFNAAPIDRALFVDRDYDGPVRGTDEDVDAYNNQKTAFDEADLAHHRHLYHANIHHADREVERLLAGVDTGRTLVVLLSDHGEAFAQHGRMGHNWMSFEEYVHIPLVLSHPLLARDAPTPERLDVPVMTIDVLPTLVELFALPQPATAPQGVSLLPLLRREALGRPYVFTSSRVDKAGTQQFAVSDGRLKYLLRLPDGAEWLFDLAHDPGEQQNLVRERAGDVERLRSVLDHWRASQLAALAEESGVELDAATREWLEQLGYLR